MTLANRTASGGRTVPSGGFELYAWFFMRVSGVLLLFLALGHLVIMHLVNNVDTIDYAFVAKRFATPFWRSYDLLMLLLAMLHGLNGARVLIDDYLKGGKRVLALAVLYSVGLAFTVAGAVVLVTFQPKAGGIF
jgi:succinate dehydrogenase / fumarate reductase, membrane anchor subunit